MEVQADQKATEMLRPARREASPIENETTLALRIPSQLVVVGAGTAVCNGVYRWAGSMSGKPFWIHEDGSERSVWYFETVCARARTRVNRWVKLRVQVVGSLWFAGWYISKRPGTIVAVDVKAAGSYVARSLSYHGAEFHVLQVRRGAAHRRTTTACTTPTSQTERHCWCCPALQLPSSFAVKRDLVRVAGAASRSGVDCSRLVRDAERANGRSWTHPRAAGDGWRRHDTAVAAPQRTRAEDGARRGLWLRERKWHVHIRRPRERPALLEAAWR
jgi:hypothetical protein